VQLDSLAAFLHVADGAALQPDSVTECFLVKSQAEPCSADALAELLVELVHACILP
jgi:hypothetical protein